MRIPTCFLFRLAMCSWIVAALLAATPAARGRAAANPLGNKDAATPPATMRLKPYVITDAQGFKGMEVLHGVMPVDWTVKGGVTWKMALGIPDQTRIHWGDAQDVCAIDWYPPILFFWSNDVGRGGRFQPGQVQHGDIIKQPPTDQFDAFDKVIIQMMRPDLAQAKVVNKEKLPDAAKAIYAQVNTDPNWPVAVWAGRETLEYELHGQTVQEIYMAFSQSEAAKAGWLQDLVRSSSHLQTRAQRRDDSSSPSTTS